MKKHLFLILAPACTLFFVGTGVAQIATPVLPQTTQKKADETPQQAPTEPPAKTPEKSPAKAPDADAEKTPEKTAPAATPAANEPSHIQEATNAYNAGIAALGKNDLANASTQFEKAVQLAPNDANANLYLGYVKLKQQDWKNAVTALEKAKENAASLDASLRPIMWNNLGLAYAKTERADDALAAYNQALKLKDDYVDARYNLAFALIAKKDYKNALPHLLALRSVNTDDKAFQTTVYNGIATAYQGLNDWGNALGAYRKVVQLNVNDVDSRFNFALALKNAGRTDEAIEQLQTLLKLRSTYTPAISLLGDIYLSQRKWGEAAKAFDQYTKAAPDDFNAWFNLGVAYDHAANFDNALAAYAKAEAINPKDPSVKNNIGRINFKRENYDDATTKLQEALKLNPAFDDARLNLGLVLMAQEKWPEAAAEWKTYLTTLRQHLAAPNVTAADKKSIAARGAEAHSALALCYMYQGLYADARDQYKKLLIAQPKNEDAKINLALCYYHTRDFAQSIKLNREIIAANPKNAIAYNNLGVALEGMNRIGEATENYQKAVEIDPDYSDAKSNLARVEAKTATS